MSGVSKSDGLTFRLVFNHQLGPRIHVFDGFNELVLSPLSQKILDGRGTPEMRRLALRWMALHRHEVLFKWRQFEERQALPAAR